MATKYPNSGILSKAKLPKINPESADYQGHIDVDITLVKQMLEEARQEGKDNIHIKLGAWIREGQYGKFFSLKASNWKPAQQQAPKQTSSFDDIDDQIPF